MLIYGHFPPMSEHSFDIWRVSSSGGVGVESLVVAATNVDAATFTLEQHVVCTDTLLTAVREARQLAPVRRR